MEARLPRAYVVELVGTFALVLFSAGVACVNQVTTAAGPPAGTTPLTLHQPGLTGLALTQGVILAVMLALTVPVSGGYLNPAVTLTLWVFNRVESARASWLIGAQVFGALLAGACLRLLFNADVLRTAHFGTPHLNPLAYPLLRQAVEAATMPWETIAAGAAVELLLTFFLVFAIFGLIGPGRDAVRAGLAAGGVQIAAALFAGPLTGAALNPARWFGPVVWEYLSWNGAGATPWVDALAYTAGPVLGALGAGLFFARLYQPDVPEPTGAAKPAKK